MEDRENQEMQERTPSRLSRRHFLGWLSWGSLTLSLGAMGTGTVAYLQPKVNYEATTTFSVGRPEDYRIGAMRVLEVDRIFVFRTPQGFQALSMTCTHLGCAYKPFGSADKEHPVVHAHCPCHGSIFSRDGRVLGGPAPRSLPFYELSLTAGGHLQVDGAKIWPSTRYLTADGRIVDGSIPDGKDIQF